jgi:hypothetical protein
MSSLRDVTIRFLLLFLITASAAQAQTAEHSTSLPTTQHLEGRYRMVPTDNLWTFLLLDSSNGRIWQVQYTVKDESPAGRWVISTDPLVDVSQEQVGRYALYRTSNMYNFILLDQVTGRAWQVQWSMDAEKRGIVQDLNTEFR